MVISIHIPKCAGTSFREILASIYGPHLWLNYGAIFSKADFKPDIVPAKGSCIHGHFFADTFDDYVPQPRLITWVRHPVDRVVSNYYHSLRSPDMRDDCCRLLHENRLTLRQYAELDWMRNLATRYLARKPIEAFTFVGVSERFDESLQVFGRTFNWVIRSHGPCLNTNPDRTTARYLLPPGDYDYILSLNQSDLAWYNSAMARLDSEMGSTTQKVA
jgi:hypothetical protein